MGDIFKLLFKEKPSLILLSLLNNNVSQYPLLLSKNISCTYCHVINTLQYLKNSNLINLKKEGRVKIIKLTEDEKKLAEYLQKTNEFLKELEQKNLKRK